MPVLTAFSAREPITIYNSKTDDPEQDWILTRILWLEGMQTGINKRGKVDTKSRYVYIHGCPDSDQMGTPGSHGCVKMRNHDIIELFDRVKVGTHVLITE